MIVVEVISTDNDINIITAVSNSSSNMNSNRNSNSDSNGNIRTVLSLP